MTVATVEAEAARLTTLIAERLSAAVPELQAQWNRSSPNQHFVIDDLLPEVDAAAIASHMPPPDSLRRLQTLREHKRVGVDVDQYAPIIGGALLAFQSPPVVEIVTQITGIEQMGPDPSLYASGVSVMGRGDFLNPHIDNSHDGDQRLYRAVNLLYYVSPAWNPADGGNLELWDPTLRDRTIVECRFNRLAVMATHRASWHSVQRVTTSNARMCLSNYYFTPLPPGGTPYRNVTSYRGRPEEPVRDVVLRLDAAARSLLARLVPSLLTRNPHRRRLADRD